MGISPSVAEEKVAGKSGNVTATSCSGLRGSTSFDAIPFAAPNRHDCRRVPRYNREHLIHRDHAPRSRKWLAEQRQKFSVARPRHAAGLRANIGTSNRSPHY